MSVVTLCGAPRRAASTSFASTTPLSSSAGRLREARAANVGGREGSRASRPTCSSTPRTKRMRSAARPATAGSEMRAGGADTARDRAAAR
ncbi:hypothetical protein MRI28_29775 [Nocardiopsis dassonvillei]|uniref:hypothetical protein n=1 Tax=Nocardiopsis dassonvillei TaxID=2014 RepID=UPI00200FE67D|nr:hypothetical protein [Nocardiopsis dassonvillei]MCK9873761.1 hypothetical protein [Nocardiopsis dassonvillei]